MLLGYHPENVLLQKNYVIDPNNLKFDISQEFDQSSSRVVGIISPCDGGIKFYLDSFDFGYSRVSEFTVDHRLAIESLLCQFDSQLSVADIFNITPSLSDCTIECVDLSIEKLSVDTIIKLCQ